MVWAGHKIEAQIRHLLRLKRTNPYRGIDDDIRYFRQKLARVSRIKEIRR